MAFISLHDNFLHAHGILDKLKKIKSELSLFSSLTTTDILSKKLNKIRDNLKSIFFVGLQDSAIRDALMSPSTLFYPDYPALQHALLSVFSDNTLTEMIDAIESCGLNDRTPDETLIRHYYQQLNLKSGYFPSKENVEPFIQLFSSIACVCRKITVLIEKNNSPDDTLAYVYAYRIMALFVDPTIQPIADFYSIAKRTDTLLKHAAAPKNTTPYHDVLLNKIYLPVANEVKDMQGWRQFIDHNTKDNLVPSLLFFSVAPCIEQQIQLERPHHLAPRTLLEAKNMYARCIYRRGAEHPELAMLCKKYNIPEDGDECSYNKCLNYLKTINWPAKLTDNLPAPVIKGEGEALGYYWVKLPTSDLRSLILGRITSCCQSIGGNSEQCVKDAVTRPDNGLYVLLKQTTGKTILSPVFMPENSINYDAFEIVGQSYAWISRTGNLVLDSLECSHDLNDNSCVPSHVVQSILGAFAAKVLHEHSSIKRITLGSGGNTPQDLGFDWVPISEDMRQGYFYGDANMQYIISKQPSRLSAVDYASFQQFDLALYAPEKSYTSVSPYDFRMFGGKRLNQHALRTPTIEDIHPKPSLSPFLECLVYFAEYLDNTTELLQNIPLLLKDTPSLPTYFTRDALFCLLRFTPTPTLEDLKSIDWDLIPRDSSSGRLMWQAQTLEQKITVLNHISAEERLLAVQEKNKLHLSILHGVVCHPQFLRMILELLPDKARLIAIQETDFYGKTVLYHAASHSPSLWVILALLPEDMRPIAVTKQDDKGRTAMHAAANNLDSLKILLSLFSKEAFFKVVKLQTHDGETLLHYAQNSPQSLSVILNHIPKELVMQAVTVQDKYYNTLLHTAANIPETLKVILDSLPKKDLLQVLLVKDRQGLSTVHHAVKYPISLTVILDRLPEEACRLVMLEENGDGYTPLSIASDYPDSFKVCLHHLSRDECIQVLKKENQYGETSLYNGVRHPELLTMLLDLCPEWGHPEAILQKDSKGRSTLHCVSRHHEALRLLLNLLPAEAQQLALMGKDEWEQTPLHFASKYPNSVMLMLDLLSEADRSKALTEKDIYGETPLHIAASNSLSLKIMIDYLPKDIVYHAIREPDIEGRTPLHFAASSPESLKMILKCIPKDEQPSALKKKDHFHRNTLDQGIRHPDSLQIILERWPNGMLLSELAEKRTHQNTILHHAVLYPKSLRIILDQLPETDRLSILKMKDHRQKTVLHRAEINPKSFDMVLDCYPLNDRFAAVNETDHDGYSVLHPYNTHPKILEIILDSLPEDALILAVKEKNQFGSKILDYASTPELLNMILNIYPPEDRVHAVTETNQNGSTIIHDAINCLESLYIILASLPEDQRLNVIKKTNANGLSVLHLTQNNRCIFKLILESFSLVDLTAYISESSKGFSIGFFTNQAEDPLLKELVIQKVTEDGHPLASITAIQNTGSQQQLLSELKKISSACDELSAYRV